MDKLLKQRWWKILAVILLVYAHTAGLLVPLKPGITSVTPVNGRTGEQVLLQVEGYNTHFLSAQANQRVWLKLDEGRALAAEKIHALSETKVSALFNMPACLPTDRKVQDFSLVIDNEQDGAFVRPVAIQITQDSINTSLGQQLWKNDNIDKLHETPGMHFPFRSILAETIRNTYFHVSLWLAMVLLFIGALTYSIRYLKRSDPQADEKAAALTTVGLLYGILGLLTGAIWAKHTWGQYWSWDIKQFTTLISLLIYFAYFVLRAAFPDQERKARVAAVYNIFAFAAMIPLIYVLPRLTDSLHPGNGGNPALGGEDLDNTMRMVFYPAIIGWTLLGVWIGGLYYRLMRIQRLINDDE